MKALIFDMDGVLFDSERPWIRFWDLAGEKLGRGGLGEVAKLCIGTTHDRTVQILKEHCGEDFPVDTLLAEAANAAGLEMEPEHYPLKPGAYEILDYLRSEGYKLGLATSTARSRVEKRLAIYHMTESFDVMVCGNEVTRSKPAPDIFLRCAEKLGSAPEETFVIEDSFNGIRAAAAAGMRPIMIPDVAQPDAEIASLAEFIVPTLMDVPAVLQRKAKVIN